MNATRTTNLLRAAARAIENADSRTAQRAIRLALREMTKLREAGIRYSGPARKSNWERQARLILGL